MGIVGNIKQYLQIYDPGYFSFVYAIKAMVAITISVLTNYYFFGSSVVVWAACLPMQIFFLNAVLSYGINRKVYMSVFAILSSLCVGLFTFLAQKALGGEVTDVFWIGIPMLILTFIAGISRAYSMDVSRLLSPTIVNSLIACLYVDSNVVLPISTAMLVVLSGSFIGIIIGFLLLDNTSNYGRYVKVFYPLVLDNLIKMMENLDNLKELTRYEMLSISMINNIKQTLNNKSGLHNDTYVVKNVKRAIFYIYKIEDICLSIKVLSQYEVSKKYPNLQKEILNNLKKLKSIFIGEYPNLNTQALEQVLKNPMQNSQDVAFNDLLKILYSKMESFYRVGSNIDTTFTATTPSSIKKVWDSMHYKNDTFRFSVKYSMAVGLSLICATLLGVDRGIWISLGVIAVARPSLGEIQEVGKEYFIGTIAGVVLGIFLVSISHGAFFYFLFGIVIFLIVYLRVFPYWLWSLIMLCGFVMLYSVLYTDFMKYAFDRLVDISIGFAFALVIFWVIWPKFSRNEIRPIIKDQLNTLTDIFNTLIALQKNYNTKDYGMLQSKQTGFLQKNNDLKQTLKDSKNEKYLKHNHLLENGQSIVKILDNLMLRENELAQLIPSLQEQPNYNGKLYLNDLQVLQLRFDMINNLLNQKPYYFRQEVGRHFLNEDNAYFNVIMQDIFTLQNQLYNILKQE